MIEIEVKLLNSDEIVWKEDWEVEAANEFFRSVFEHKTTLTVFPEEEQAAVIPVSSIAYVNIYKEI